LQNKLTDLIFGRRIGSAAAICLGDVHALEAWEIRVAPNKPWY